MANKAEWIEINRDGNNYTCVMELGSVLLIRSAVYCDINDQWVNSSIVSVGRNDLPVEWYQPSKDTK
jgi:hypothetical protein